MRITLIVGAAFCSIIGLFLGYGLVNWMMASWWRYLSKSQGGDLLDLLFWPILVVLAFAPAIMLILWRRVEKPKWRFSLIGINELFVVGMYLYVLLKIYVG